MMGDFTFASESCICQIFLFFFPKAMKMNKSYFGLYWHGKISKVLGSSNSRQQQLECIYD